MRLCWLCKHFDFEEGSPHCSEVTPGYDFHMRCGKSHWDFNNTKSSEEDFKRYLTMATKCEDYKKHNETR
jgi:hypothetical protein